jgi:hypothetical protein
MSLAMALGWKFNHEPGIRTKENLETGEMELTGWPEKTLGPAPDKARQAAIMAEYEAHLAQQVKEPSETEVLLEALKDKAVIVNGDIDAAKERLRQSR